MRLLCYTFFFLLRSRQFFILTNNTKVMDIEDYSNGCLSVEFRHLVRRPIHCLISFMLIYAVIY